MISPPRGCCDDPKLDLAQHLIKGTLREALAGYETGEIVTTVFTMMKEIVFDLLRERGVVDGAGTILPLADMIKPLLAGHPPMVQSAVLAELTSIWLAGHVVIGNNAETQKLHDDLLTNYMRLVVRLAKINHEMIHGKQEKCL